MLDMLAEYGLFLLQTLTVLVAVLVVVRAIARSRGGERGSGRLEVSRLDHGLRKLVDAIESEALPRKVYRQRRKARVREERARDKGATTRPRVYVLTFEGDIRASAVESLRREVTAICAVASEGEEVLVRLSSSGGVVHSYGLAAAQLERLRQRGLTVVAAIDKVAASGGYLMACVADRVLAAPFAVVGSIGVVAMVPNVHRALKKHDVDVELVTAGRFKRTLTVFGQNTDEDRAKFQEQLEEVHELFKTFVGRYRPDLDLDAVATGEHWYGSRALELGLVDELRTSDDYLLARADDAELLGVTWRGKRSLGSRLGGLVSDAVGQVLR